MPTLPDKRIIKFRVYTEISPEVLGMKYFDLNNTSEINDTVMQFTGLLDKNGVEIYEGDIVRYKGFRGGHEWEFEEVPELRILFHLYGEHIFVPELSQVVGNIYETPELIHD